MSCVSVPHPGLLKESLDSPGTAPGEAEHSTTLFARLLHDALLLRYPISARRGGNVV